MTVIRSRLILFIIVFYIFGCSSQQPDTSKNTHKTNVPVKMSYKNTRYSIHQKTAEFMPDKHTLGLWHFSEKKNAFVFDLSPYEHDIKLSKKKQWDTGLINSSYLFDGAISGFIKSIPDTSKINIQDELTIDIIVKLSPHTSKDNLPILTKYIQPSHKFGWNYRLIIINETQDNNPSTTKLKPTKLKPTIYWQVMDTSKKIHQVSLKQDISELYKKWLYISVSYSKNKIKIYLNGELQAEADKPRDVFPSTGYLLICKTPNKKYGANMVIDELHLSKIERHPRAIAEYAKNLNQKFQYITSE